MQTATFLRSIQMANACIIEIAHCSTASSWQNRLSVIRKKKITTFNALNGIVPFRFLSRSVRVNVWQGTREALAAEIQTNDARAARLCCRHVATNRKYIILRPHWVLGLLQAREALLISRAFHGGVNLNYPTYWTWWYYNVFFSYFIGFPGFNTKIATL